MNEREENKSNKTINLDTVSKKMHAPIRNDRKPLQELIPLRKPLRLYIDPCDACNFKCHFCFQAKVKDFVGTMMKPDLFNKVVEQVKEFGEPINVIHLYGYGEPLLNPDIVSYVEKIKKEKIAKEIVITTNGSLLNHDLSLRLANSGLTRLSISLNGLSDEQFKKNVRSNVNYERLCDEIRFFYENRGDVHVHIKIDGDDYSDEDKNRFIETFVDYCDSINIDNIADIWPGLNMSDDKSVTMYGTKYNKNDFICPMMFYNLTIHADGTVSPCGVDYSFRKQNLGNVHNNTIKEIWGGEQMKKMWIDELTGSQSDYDICNKCSRIGCASVDISEYRDNLISKICGKK